MSRSGWAAQEQELALSWLMAVGTLGESDEPHQ